MTKKNYPFPPSNLKPPHGFFVYYTFYKLSLNLPAFDFRFSCVIFLFMESTKHYGNPPPPTLSRVERFGTKYSFSINVLLFPIQFSEIIFLLLMLSLLFCAEKKM